MRLKDKHQRVIEVSDESCYKPNKRGVVQSALGGFSYFRGKPTTDPITHELDHGNGSLAERGGLKRVSK